MKVIKIFLTLVIFASVFSGCSLGTNSAMDNPGQLSSPESPVAVSVVQSYREGEQVNVKIKLEAKTDVRADEVIVGVLGLKDSSVVEEEYKKLSDVVSAPMVQSGTGVIIPFLLADEGLTEFQIKCSWGEDAKTPELAKLRDDELDEEMGQEESARARLASSHAIPGLPERSVTKIGSSGLERAATTAEIVRDPIEDIIASEEARIDYGKSAQAKRLELTQTNISTNSVSCDNPPCDVLYDIQAKILNNSEKTVRGVKLAAGIFWAGEGQEAKTPDYGKPLQASEKEIVLSDVVLRPGESQVVQVRVDRPIPIVTGGSFVPNLRVLTTQ